MKKKWLVVSGLAVGIVVVVFVGLHIQKPSIKTAPHKYADARLSMLEVQQGIETKIASLLDGIKERDIKPTEKGLTQLMQAITVIRAYGKDISTEAKSNLLEIAKQLRANGFGHEILLKKLDTLARGSQELIG